MDNVEGGEGETGSGDDIGCLHGRSQGAWGLSTHHSQSTHHYNMFLIEKQRVKAISTFPSEYITSYPQSTLGFFIVVVVGGLLGSPTTLWLEGAPPPKTGKRGGQRCVEDPPPYRCPPP